MKCEICGKEYETCIALVSHIRQVHENIKDYYNKYIGKGECKTCGKETKFISYSRGYRKYCSIRCSRIDEEKRETIIEQCNKNFKNNFNSLDEKDKEIKKEYCRSGAKKVTIKEHERSLERFRNIVEDIEIVDLVDGNFECRCLRCEEKFTISWQNLRNRVIDYKTISCVKCNPIKKAYSSSEKDVLEFVKSVYNGEIKENVRNVIAPYELDIWIPEKNIAIEFDGTYWHMDCKEYNENDWNKTLGMSAKEIWERDEEKSRKCQEKGIRLIRIKENDWRSNRNTIEKYIFDNLV